MPRYGLILLTILLVGCNNDRISKLKKQNPELLAEVKKNNAAAEYDMQAKCSEDSKIWFKHQELRDKDTLFLKYTNHYNKSQNKCFIFVQLNYSIKKPSWVASKDLWDIYEKRECGSVSVTHQISLKPRYGEVESVDWCRINGKPCKTLDEFDDVVRTYMNE